MKIPQKYYKKRSSNTVSVHYFLEADKERQKISNTACYATVMNAPIDMKWKTILLQQPVGSIPYTRTQVIRWINDINELGFPCHFEKMGKTLNIRLILTEFVSKIHLASTLMLLRVLWENGMNHIPDLYFQAMDENPRADRLVQIQKAHKHPGLLVVQKPYYPGDKPYTYSSYNTGHTVTSHWNKKNIRRTELMKRMKKGDDVFKGSRSPVAMTWRVDMKNGNEWRNW